MRRDNIPPGYISRKEIQAAQRYYRIGRTVMVHTYKAQGIGSLGHTGEMHRGKIVDNKNPHFALVKLHSGVLDSIFWSDLVLQMRKKKSGEQSPEIKN